MCEYSKDILDSQCREILADIKKNGRERPWRWKKAGAIVMSEVYKRLGWLGKAERMDRCAQHLAFKDYENGGMVFHTAYFCKVRMCPVCAMRRSEKIFGQVSRIMDYMDHGGEYEKLKYIFVTLTIRNMPGGELGSAMDKLYKGFHTLIHRKEFKALSKGWFRAIEVTYNWDGESYHPHFHMIIAVSEKYFTVYENYLDHSGWMELWKSCMGLDYDPWVYVEKVRPSKKVRVHDKKKMGHVVAELAKYTVKDDDYLIQWVDTGGKYKVHLSEVRDEKRVEKIYGMMESVVSVLDPALSGRRLVAFGGIFKAVHKKLNLSDPVDGDLGEADELGDEKRYTVKGFSWHDGIGVGVGNYRAFKTDSKGMKPGGKGKKRSA